MDVDPLQLVKRVVIDDDHHAFKTLVKLYQSPIRQFMRRMMKKDELADEVAQDTFLQAYRKMDQFRGSDFKAWIFTIAYRLALKRLKKEQLHSTLLDHSLELPSANVALRVDLNTALGFLKDQERQILIDWLEQDLSHRELAQVHNLPIGTIKSKILRARKKLKVFMDSWKVEV